MDGGSSLFRQEAIDHRKDRWFGRPQLLRPISTIVATWLAVISVVAIGLFIAFGDYTRRVRLSGTVQSSVGVVRLVAPQTGRVVAGTASEGQLVRQGEELYRLSLDSTTSGGNTRANIISELQLQRKELVDEIERRKAIDLQQKDGLNKQALSWEKEIAQVTTQIAVTQNYVDTLRQLSEQLDNAVAKGIVAQREYESRRTNFMEKQTLLEGLRRDLIQLEARLSDVRSKLASFDGESASTISGLHRQIAIAGTPLLSILPATGQLEVHFFASSSAIGFVRKGSQVLLRYAPFPYQKFGQYPGVVTEISRVALRSADGESAIPAQVVGQQSPTGFYRVTVRPEQETVLAYGAREPFRSAWTWRLMYFWKPGTFMKGYWSRFTA
ncbi:MULTISPECIES: HlyD family secretion protein [Phyllobacterium]|uniref:HlyD family secretion protein n=1 Tax=Phyllobacterium TaxID=28100 RepID=UPI001CBA8C88|nr:HlyD family efflux transporter periplasmic adaptor subunit [Phyllobacterium calauticae]MBZ3695452.1 HlyD family efflux transporter periplasmic adaptor subunit [Phyllobacterium calauticae]